MKISLNSNSGLCSAGKSLCLSECISLAEGQKKTVEALLRVVKFTDPRYGVVDITRPMLSDLVDNFMDRTYGQDIAVDISHKPQNGAAGFIRGLGVSKNTLFATIEWTELGTNAVVKKGFRYLSAEYSDNYKDPETGTRHGPTLIGAALTTRPAVKNLRPVHSDCL